MSENRFSLADALAHIQLSIPDESAAFLALREALERGDFHADASTWGPPDPIEARAQQRFKVPLLAETWAETTELHRAHRNSIRFPKSWSNPEEGFLYAHGVHVPRDSVERFWPAPKAKAAGGRPSRWDWEGAMIEMARVAIMGEDSSRPVLTRAVTDWFVEHSGDHPALSEIRDRVKRFHESIWPPRT